MTTVTVQLEFSIPDELSPEAFLNSLANYLLDPDLEPAPMYQSLDGWELR